MDRPRRQHPHIAGPDTTALIPVDLRDEGAARPRGPGWSLRLASPSPLWAPPGQGQVLVALQGDLRVEERSADTTKVMHTARRDRAAALPPGQAFLVANDAEWRLLGEGTALAIATSVPRREERGGSRGTLLRNEAVVIERIVGRLLPSRGVLAPAGECLVGLEHGARIEVRDGARWAAVAIAAGLAVHVPEGVVRRVRAGAALSIRPVRAALPGSARREDARGFTPFG